jgi:hypothetical protein
MKRSTPVLHPLFLGLYPVLALLGHNIGQVRAADAWRSLVAALLLSLLCYAAWRALTHDPHQSGFMASLTLLVFFGYGHDCRRKEGREEVTEVVSRYTP